jgi:hypothetical protein
MFIHFYSFGNVGVKCSMGPNRFVTPGLHLFWEATKGLRWDSFRNRGSDD